ncbi:MAG: major facilitator superfamily 1 [Phycisphaerales bacterium]|nr:major facilitator superfamily 1 [Phycisphaerales bacterium]
MTPAATPPPDHPVDTFTSPTTDALPLARPKGNIRWVICALLFFATTINYMDRQIIGILKPTMAKDLHWDDKDYANIVIAFQLMYAFGQLGAGRLIDYIGVRLGYALAVVGWSLAAMATGTVRTVSGFAVARGALGIAEGGNFPAAIKTISEWFPQRDRSYATGIFNAGSNVGAMVTPLMVPLIVARFGWQAAFYATGAVGLLWAVLWLAIYQKPQQHRLVSKEELVYIESHDPTTGAADPEEPRVPLLQLAFRRSTLAYIAGLAMTSPVWWFYLFWGADFLNRRFGLSLTEVGWPLATIYLMADVGSIGGGWMSTHLQKRGWSVNAARKSTMLVFCLMVVPVYFATLTNSAWVAVALVGLAAAAHQGWSANLYTLASDTTSKASVSSVIGLGGFVGGLCAVGTSWAIGDVLKRTNSFYLPFAIASVMYLLALLVIQLLVPRIGARDEPKP